MDVVGLIFAAWRKFGLLYAEWKREWPAEHNEDYKHQRALSFLQRAIDFADAMANKSWYVFLTVWVVACQIGLRGDLFPYSTAPI